VKSDVDSIVDKLPPPGELGRGGESDEPAEEGDYDAGLDSMGAFIAAVKSGDAAAALDAYRDVKKNC